MGRGQQGEVIRANLRSGAKCWGGKKTRVLLLRSDLSGVCVQILTIRSHFCLFILAADDGGFEVCRRAAAAGGGAGVRCAGALQQRGGRRGLDGGELAGKQSPVFTLLLLLHHRAQVVVSARCFWRLLRCYFVSFEDFSFTPSSHTHTSAPRRATVRSRYLGLPAIEDDPSGGKNDTLEATGTLICPPLASRELRTRNRGEMLKYFRRLGDEVAHSD